MDYSSSFIHAKHSLSSAEGLTRRIQLDTAEEMQLQREIRDYSRSPRELCIEKVSAYARRTRKTISSIEALLVDAESLMSGPFDDA